MIYFQQMVQLWGGGGGTQKSLAGCQTSCPVPMSKSNLTKINVSWVSLSRDGYKLTLGHRAM